ncbi:hypothetical protein C5L14_29050 [Labrys okinawensis]|uniref:Uncharacterized protein n=1 Tax=Labrys okinawensis TaxID=346911 RepID=A0A2S9Q480_9HYPH|nr:hypothetical protein [Labrys okinawensis]PRH84120.1 hypothetical protein C5L14_29050 [Labrys okinawensis]
MSLTAVAIVASTVPVRADAQALRESRRTWQACQHVGGEDWLGWRRGAPGHDTFQYWRADRKKPAVLRLERQIGELAREKITYCFGSDGALAFIRTRTDAVNAAEGRHRNRPVSRVGSIQVGPGGGVLKVTGAVVDDRGRPHALNNRLWVIPAVCEALPLYASREEVERALAAGLGDGAGKRPAFEPATLAWCAKAEFDPS